MLTVTIPAVEMFDERTNEFVYTDEITLQLEHSLVSLSKWEETWEKPFLSSDVKTTEETLDYIRTMCLTPNVPAQVFKQIPSAQLVEINNYIDSKMTATWFSAQPSQPRRRETITAEIIYYWMHSLEIPLDWENRHLNKLFTLIKVFNEKNQPDKKKKMSQRDIAARNHEINQRRLAEMKTRG